MKANKGKDTTMGGHKPASFSYVVENGRLVSIQEPEEKPVVQKAAEVIIIIIIISIVAAMAFGFNAASWFAGTAV